MKIHLINRAKKTNPAIGVSESVAGLGKINKSRFLGHVNPFKLARIAMAAMIAVTTLLLAAPLQAATPMTGIKSSSKFMIYYGSDFTTNNMNSLTNFDVVVIDANVGTCLPSSVAYLQAHGVKYVLAYISIGEEPASVPTVVGNGDGPVYFTNGVYHFESNGVASFYVDQNWDGSSYVSDGLPDTNIFFFGKFILPNSDWRWVIDNQRIGGSAALPSRSLAGLQQLMGTRSSNTDSNRNNNFGVDGVFLDTLDTAGPFVNSWGYYAWAAPEMQQTVKFIHDTYSTKTIFANRGIFFFNPTLLNTTYNIRPYDYNIRPYINGSLYESYTLDSDVNNPTNSPYFAENKNNYAPKIINEANRPDGFTVFCVDYQMNRGNTWYNQAKTNSAVANGWVEYQSPDGGLALIGQYMLTNPPATDTQPPVWDSTAANSSSPVAARVGIQSVVAGQNLGDAVIHWDVARDQTTPVGYNILRSTNAAFTSVTVYSNVAFGVGDGWAQDPTTAFANKYTLTGLPAGTNYFRVRAHDGTASKFEETNTVTLSLIVQPNEFSNPLTTNVVVDGSLADWNNLRAFTADTVDGTTPIDWVSAWMGHTLTQFYLAFTNTSAVTINGAVNIYFDTDASRTTGFRSGANTFPIGAEYLLQGGSLYKYIGTGTDWNWSFVGSVSWTTSGNKAECSFPRIWLADSSNINLFFYGDNPSVGGTAVDVMPNNALQAGGGGGFFNYRVHDFMNPLTTNIVINANLTDWNPYQAFGSCAQVSTVNNTVNLANMWMGHNTNLFYVGLTNYTSATYDTRFILYLDTDGSRSAGFRGTADNLPIGAEYRVSGTNVQKYTGTGLNNTWSNVATITRSTLSNVTEYSFSQASIGNPKLVNLVFAGSNSTTSINYYPTYAANVGGGGQFFTYRVGDVANRVTNNAIVLDGSVAEWSTLKPFGTDPADATGAGDQLDWGTLMMANDPTNLFFAFQNYTSISSLNGVWNIYLDTDGNRLTGFRGGADNYPIGADYLLQGINLYRYTGTGLDWNWTAVGSIAYIWNVATAEFSFPRSWIGSPSLIKVFYYADNPSGGGVTTDLSPDNAFKTGGGGAFYIYRAN